MLSVDEKQLKSLHTRTNLRRFLEYVQNGQVEKVTKMCSKGLDPNFHCQDSGGKYPSYNTSKLKCNLLQNIFHLCRPEDLA